MGKQLENKGSLKTELVGVVETCVAVSCVRRMSTPAAGPQPVFPVLRGRGSPALGAAVG